MRIFTEITFEEYIAYIRELSISELRIEATILKNYSDYLNKVYKGLIDLIKDDIVINIKNDLYFNIEQIDKIYILNKLSLLDDYLKNEVSGFFNIQKNTTQNIEISSDFIELDEKKLYETIIKNYSLIYAVKEQKDPNPMFEFVITYKGMNYSLFDAMSNLYHELSLKVKLYIEQLHLIDKDNIIGFTNDFLIEIISITEKYHEHYIDITPKFKEILEKDIYFILLKYNCLNTLKEILLLPSLVGFDLTDLLQFLNNTLIVKIINNNQEIVLSNLKPNKLLISGFNDCNTMEDVMNKVNRYQKECIDDSEYLLGNSTNFLAVYLIDKNRM